MANNKLQFKRYNGTESTGIEYKDIVLAFGEPFFDYKRKLIYVGDGTSTVENLSPFGATDGLTIIDNINATPVEISGKIDADHIQQPNGSEIIDSINADNSTNKISASHLDVQDIDISGESIINKINNDSPSGMKISDDKINKQTGPDIIDAINSPSSDGKLINANRIAGGGGGDVPSGSEIVSLINDDTSGAIISKSHVEQLSNSELLSKINSINPQTIGKINSDLLQTTLVPQDTSVDNKVSFDINGEHYEKTLNLTVEGQVDQARTVTNDINGRLISSIFEGNSSTVKTATTALTIPSTGKISGHTISDVFDVGSENILPCKNAINASNANNVVSKIGGKNLTDIFVPSTTTPTVITTVVKESSHASNADSANMLPTNGKIGTVEVSQIFTSDGTVNNAENANHSTTSDLSEQTKAFNVTDIGGPTTPIYIDSNGKPSQCTRSFDLIIPSTLSFVGKRTLSFVVGTEYTFDETGYSYVYNRIDSVLSNKNSGKYYVEINNELNNTILASVTKSVSSSGVYYKLEFNTPLYNKVGIYNFVIDMYSNTSGYITRTIGDLSCYLNAFQGSSFTATSNRLYRHTITLTCQLSTLLVPQISLSFSFISNNNTVLSVNGTNSTLVNELVKIGRYSSTVTIPCNGYAFNKFVRSIYLNGTSTLIKINYGTNESTTLLPSETSTYILTDIVDEIN